MGSTPPMIVTALAWAAVVAAAVLPIWRRRRRDPDLRGGRASALLRARAPELVSAARTASELERAVPAGASPGIVAAQRDVVLAQLASHPPRAVIGRRALLVRENLLALLVILVAALVASQSTRVGAGLFALAHPGARTERAERVAVLAQLERVTVTPPTYLDEPPSERGATSRVTAPRGASVELTLRALASDVRDLELRFADGRTLPLALDARRRATLRFLASRSTTARIVGEHEGAPILDATTLVFDVEDDRAPTVHLTEPRADGEVDPGDLVVVVADAEDDHRLDRLEIVITTMDGAERRTPFLPSDALPAVANGLVPVLISELNAEPGDTIQIHAEARDLDDLDGPHVSRSPTRTIRLRGVTDRAAASLQTLEAIREAALGLLADRIDAPPPSEEASARARFETLAPKTRGLVASLAEVANGGLEGTVRSTDRGVYDALGRALAQRLDEERRLHGPRLQSLEARASADARAITTLEDTTITLSSLLLRARTDDAAAIARELDALRRQMTSLLAELRRARTPEAMRELTRTLARARQRLAELRARMARMGEGAPREFENVSEQDLEQTEQALARMETALASDDLDAAARALTGLEQEIDQLARALGQGQEAVTEERFGERERAIADVIDRLMSLEAEQRELATRTATTQRRVVDRAIEADAERARDAARGLAGQARRAIDALGATPRELSATDRDAWSEGRERLRDVEAALSSGDLGEARRMASEAEEALGALGRSLDLDAMMFPGHEGQLGARARSAREGERAARELERAIERAIPNLEQHLEASERASLTGDRERQASARRATSELAERLERLPMGGAGGEIATGLRQVSESMERAEERLSNVEPSEAARAQAEAAERLTEIRRRIEQEQQGGGGGGGSDASRSRESVVIPDASAFEAPMEQRRRVLDAMGDPAPRGYDESIRRYYEGLLR